jgi:DNA-binding transcriptional regulator YiaG
MTPTQFRAALAKLDLSQLGAARLFGVGERTPRRWIAGDSEIPEMAAILLRLLLAKKISAEDIEGARK